MTINKGEMDNLDSIVEIIRDAVAEMEKQGIHQWDEIYPARSDIESDIKKGNLFTVWETDSLAAIYVLSQECDEEYKKCAWTSDDDSAYILHRLCVSPKFQNRGMAKRILDHIEKQVLELNMKSIRLDVFSENPYALRLYENFGYERKGFADWRKGRFYLMEKVLR